MMTEDDWNVILGRVEAGRCTPFLGAAANYGILPLGSQIAQERALEFGFPLDSSGDLATVAQFSAVKHNDPVFPKDKILERFAKEKDPHFSKRDERLDCLRALAELPLPVYWETPVAQNARIAHECFAAFRRSSSARRRFPDHLLGIGPIDGG
jgi:hypothetical protein